MNEQELESMVVRLVGDASSYLLMIKTVLDSTTAAAKTVEEQAQNISKSMSTQAAAAQSAAATGGAAGAAADKHANSVATLSKLLSEGTITQSTFNREVLKSREAMEAATKEASKLGEGMKELGGIVVGALAGFGLVSSLKGAFAAFSGKEKMMAGLTAAIEANGGAVQSTIVQYKAFAEQMAAETTITKSSVLSMLKMAESQGITGDAAEKAALQAANMSAATGQSAESFLRMTVALAQGNVQMLRRIPALRGIHDTTQLVAKAQQLMASGAAIAAAEAETTAGRITQLGKSFTDTSKQIGGMVDTAIRPVVIGMQYLVGAFNNASPAVKVLVTAVLASSVALASGAALWGVFSAQIIGAGLAIAKVSIAIYAFSASLLANPITWWVVGIAAAAAGVAYLVYSFTSTGDAMRDFNDQIERGKKLTEDLISVTNAETKAMLEQAGKLSGDEKRDFFEAMLKDAKTNMDGIKAAIVNAKKEVDNFAFGGGKQATVSREELKAMEAMLDAMGKRATEASKALKEMEVGPKVQEQMKNLKEHLEKSVATFGMEDVEKKLYSINELIKKGREEGGGGEVEERKLAEVRGLAAQELALKQAKKASDELASSAKQLATSLASTNEKLVEQVDTFGMSSTEVELYKLSLKGASDAELEHLRAMHSVADALKGTETGMSVAAMAAEKLQDSQEKLAQRITRLGVLLASGAIDAVTYANAVAKAGEDANKALAGKGAEITKSMMTPAEKLAEKQKELGNLFSKGAITAETYARALAKAGNEAKALASANGVLAGSAQAIADMKAFRDTLDVRLPVKQAIDVVAKAPMEVKAPAVFPSIEEAKAALKIARDAAREINDPAKERAVEEALKALKEAQNREGPINQFAVAFKAKAEADKAVVEATKAAKDAEAAFLKSGTADNADAFEAAVRAKAEADAAAKRAADALTRASVTVTPEGQPFAGGNGPIPLPTGKPAAQPGAAPKTTAETLLTQIRDALLKRFEQPIPEAPVIEL
jgi:hypothetical protein